MSARTFQGSLQATLEADANVQVLQGSLQAVGQADASVKTYQTSIQAVVRFFPINLIAKIHPPIPFPQTCSCNPVCCFELG